MLDEINQMKKDPEVDASRLAILIETKESLVRDSELEEHLKDLFARILADLDNCTCQHKKDACAYLDLKVTATPEGVDIKGYVQPKLLTTGQAWACLPFHEYVV